MKEDSLIFNVGKLDEIQVYLNPDEDESVVYFGNYDSTTILINKNIQDEDLKICSLFKEGRSLIVEYLFLETGRTKLLKVS
jgi:regulatory protein YycH of two-component signal transduction system YycFG